MPSRDPFRDPPPPERPWAEAEREPPRAEGERRQRAGAFEPSYREREQAREPGAEHGARAEPGSAVQPDRRQEAGAWERPTLARSPRPRDNWDMPRDTPREGPRPRSWAGAGPLAGASGAQQADDTQFDADYRQWRDEQMRLLDQDYAQWRRERYRKFAEEFSQWRSQRLKAQASTVRAGDEGPAALGDISPLGGPGERHKPLP